MIGPNRHTVEVVGHDPTWMMLAVEACQAVRSACGELVVDLQHVGSTAVPDLLAKPILDIAAAVVTFDAMPRIIRRLTGIGYLYRGDYGAEGGHLFVAESSPDVRTIHLHIVEYSGSQWRNHLLFRDLLRHNLMLRKRYAELRRDLVNICHDDRRSYTVAKAEFIHEVLDKSVVQADSSGNEIPAE